MTCKAMRSRLLPRMWERISLPQRSWETFGRNLVAVINALHVNPFLATSVKYFCMLLRSWVGADL